MSRNYKNLNVNPCKMCMPMGAVMAFKGIEDNMVIIHGSQGCSTYIRRHMATHYNEPIDIASSSLTEDGTVFGGSKNLKKGLTNMIKLYEPKTIGVITTCLAETIGEDIERIVAEYYEETGISEVDIVPVHTPGYGGTQEEGYYSALKGVVERYSEKGRGNGKINIICGNLNPGDVRALKEMLEKLDIPYILLPDVSETLDGPYEKEYSRIRKGGTTINDIKDMANSIATIEMGIAVPEDSSPGAYLRDKFNVPLYKCSLPFGLRNTDKFLELLCNIAGKELPESITTDRGRYLDTMVDNHKFTGRARAVIYGEAELVIAMVKLCRENGIVPKIVATGSNNPKVIEILKEETMNLGEECILLKDTDFETIESLCKEQGVNIIIGSSDGRRMASRLNLKVVRVAFPVHDRVGAQRKCITLYRGSALLLDEIANVIIEETEESFREEAFNKYFVDNTIQEEKKLEEDKKPKEDKKQEGNNMTTNLDKNLNHPCFNKDAHDCARIHLPVAPKCNISCNYCSRKYDCANESRPGVTSEVLTPEQGFARFKEAKEKIGKLTVLGIAGPGDALANFEETKKTIELIKAEYPDTIICLSTNGLMLPFYAQELVNLGVSHVTVTINTVDKTMGAKIYKFVNYLGTTYTGEKAAEILLNNQLAGLKFLSSHGVVCKVNIVMLKGINDNHIEEVVKTVKEHGAFITNIMQHIPVKESVFSDLSLVSNQELNAMRKTCEGHLKQMYHCKQCRADAVGILAQDRSIEFRGSGCGSSCSQTQEGISIKSYKFAITTKSGTNIDQHFGMVEELYVYSYSAGKVKFLEKRPIAKYCTGKAECDDHEDKIEKIIKTIEDCDAVLTMRAGLSPEKKLQEKGIKLLQMYDGIDNGIREAAKLMNI